jgi:hypothetical protein
LDALSESRSHDFYNIGFDDRTALNKVKRCASKLPHSRVKVFANDEFMAQIPIAPAIDDIKRMGDHA